MCLCAVEPDVSHLPRQRVRVLQQLGVTRRRRAAPRQAPRPPPDRRGRGRTRRRTPGRTRGRPRRAPIDATFVNGDGLFTIRLTSNIGRDSSCDFAVRCCCFLRNMRFFDGKFVLPYRGRFCSKNSCRNMQNTVFKNGYFLEGILFYIEVSYSSVCMLEKKSHTKE